MAEVTNPALADLSFLVGRWAMTLSNASFLDAPNEIIEGRLEIEVIEDGNLLAMRQIRDPEGPPLASWVIGRDESHGDYTVLYIDDRPVSRVYEMSFTGDEWRIWRDHPEFAQRFVARVSADRRVLEGRWEKRMGSGDWEHDFDVAYTRE